MDTHSIKLLMLAVVQEQDRDMASHALERLNLPVVYYLAEHVHVGDRLRDRRTLSPTSRINYSFPLDSPSFRGTIFLRPGISEARR